MRTIRRSSSGLKSSARRKVRLKPKPAPEMSAAASEKVARYIADMTVQLASMASSANLELLAYFLKMAHAECVSQFRQPADVAID